ncbi:MAG: dephospho-CoA kinase [Sphingobacteriaceae bacterium]|nr:dephospho-CoA kinase [Sphingobacteriaceae bacterium]
MLKIGITGGIGSGKTMVCKIFESLGVPVFYADLAAKKLMTNNKEVVQAVKNTFGADCYFANQSLNTQYLANIVFNDAEKLTQLNAIVHPATFEAFDKWLEKVPSGTNYILKEAALLFESDSYKYCDKSILVLANENLRLKRVQKRDKMSELAIKARMNKQLSDEEKMKRADFFIDNNETKSVIAQVLQLHQQFNTQQ